MEINSCYFGDARDGLRAIRDAGIRPQTVVTSPPYYGLRDYGHPGQLGLERTPDEYIAAMVEVFALVRDVLADDGTLWLNIGDSYAANRTKQITPTKWKSLDFGKSNATTVPSGMKPKDLIGIPWMLAFALRADGWYLRQDIIWHKPNPMPESVRDRCTKAHEYMFLLSKSERYYFDSEAISEEAVSKKGRGVIGRGSQGSAAAVAVMGRRPQQDHSGWMGGDGETRNRRSVWTIATTPYSGAHFATFPPALIEPCILAGSRPGDVVLDPFLGSGTTAQVAHTLGRKWVGVELNPEYATLQTGRIAKDYRKKGKKR